MAKAEPKTKETTESVDAFIDAQPEGDLRVAAGEEFGRFGRAALRVFHGTKFGSPGQKPAWRNGAWRRYFRPHVGRGG